MGLFSVKQPLIGLDIGASSIKIVRGTRRKNTFHVEQLVIIPLPHRTLDERGIANAEILSGALKASFAEYGKKKMAIATSLKGGGLISKRITIPKIPPKEIPDQVKWEAEQVFPQEVDSMVIDYLLLGEGGLVPGSPDNTAGIDLLLIGIRDEEAYAFYDIIEQAGMKMKYFDIDSFVTSSMIGNFVEVITEEPTAFVDIGSSATRIGVSHRGNTVFLREFPIGGDYFTDAIATSLGLSFEDAESLKIQPGGGIPQEAMATIENAILQWKSELQQCEDMFVTQSATGSINRWYLFGGGSLTPGLQESLQDERFGGRILAFPAQEIFKAKGKVSAELLAAWAPRLVSATGLACLKA